MPPTLDELTSTVEGGLREVLDSRRMPLYRMMAYHLGWESATGDSLQPPRAERRHGVACLAACYATGGEADLALPAATGVELVQNSTQVHDDIQSGVPARNGRDTVWWVWGPAQAINVGDGMYALARLATFGMRDREVSAAKAFRAVQMVDEASLQSCEGRFQDLEAQERIDLSVDSYLEMASGKTGALYACAMKLGALVGSDGNEASIDAYGAAGDRLGVASQVQGDVRQIWGARQDSEASLEVLNKKKLLPVVYALEKAKVSEKRRIGEIYFKRVLEPDDVAPLRAMLDELGARTYCEELVGQLRGEAEAALQGHTRSDGGADLLGKLLEDVLGE